MTAAIIVKYKIYTKQKKHFIYYKYGINTIMFMVDYTLINACVEKVTKQCYNII